MRRRTTQFMETVAITNAELWQMIGKGILIAAIILIGVLGIYNALQP